MVRRRAALRAFLLAAAALAVATGLAGSAAGEARVYRAKQRTAEELLPLAQAAMEGAGSAVVDPGTNSLVLLGDPGSVAAAVALLEAQDRALASVVIHYEERRLQDLDASGIDVRWSTGSEHLRVGNAVHRGGGTRVAIRPQATESRGESHTGGTLRVLDGHAGRITTGSIVPLETRRLEGGPRGRRFAVTETARVAADTGFEVRPRVLSDGKVRLDIRPFGARVLPDGRIATSGASTVVVLEDGGEPAVIGGLGSGGSSQSRSLSGSSTSTGRDDRVLLLSVELE